MQITIFIQFQFAISNPKKLKFYRQVDDDSFDLLNVELRNAKSLQSSIEMSLLSNRKTTTNNPFSNDPEYH